MPYEMIECSPQAKAKIASTEDAIGTKKNPHQQTKYPFDELPIGWSFGVPYSEANEGSLRALASMKAKATKKRFAVLKHAEVSLFEVARIA